MGPLRREPVAGRGRLALRAAGAAAPAAALGPATPRAPLRPNELDLVAEQRQVGGRAIELLDRALFAEVFSAGETMDRQPARLRELPVGGLCHLTAGAE